MVDLGEDEDRFESFMLPITSAFQFVGAQLANATEGAAWNEAETKVPTNLSNFVLFCLKK